MTPELQNFNGELNPIIRSALYAQRRSLGFTLQRAAHFCQVNVSTYRKWEGGPTKQCGTDKIQYLKQFLSFQNNLKYLKYNMHSDCFHISVFRTLPEQLYCELDQQFNIIHLSQNNTSFQKEYLQALQKFNQEQLKILIDSHQCRRNTKNNSPAVSAE